jgi:hypothetical protein
MLKYTDKKIVLLNAGYVGTIQYKRIFLQYCSLQACSLQKSFSHTLGSGTACIRYFCALYCIDDILNNLSYPVYCMLVSMTVTF